MSGLVSHDAVVVLGGGVSPAGELSAWSRQRLDTGLALMDRGMGSELVLSGGWALTGERPDRLEADVMAGIAAERVDPARIHMERRSRDTVGNAWFTRGIARDEGWSQLCVVTSDFHVARAAWIFERILGGITCTWVPAPSGLEGHDLLRAATQEVVLLTFLREWMADADPGDEASLERFIRRHPGYSEDPALDRDGIEERLEAIRRRLGVER